MANLFGDENPAVAAMMKAAGFAVWQTGGNCLAYGRNLPQGGYVLITERNGFLPEKTEYAALEVYLGRYDRDGEWQEEEDEFFTSIAAALKMVAAIIEDNAPLPTVGQKVRFRDYVERFPDCLFAPGRTATVTESSAEAIYARVDDMTDAEAAPLAEWGGCVQWAGDDPADEAATVAAWFWRECETV